MVVISDKKMGVHTGGSTTDAEYYAADVRKIIGFPARLGKGHGHSKRADNKPPPNEEKNDKDRIFRSINMQSS